MVRSWRAAIVLGLGSVAVLWLMAKDACPETAVLAGYGSTRGMGEQKGSPEAAITVSGQHAAVDVSWFGADKLESGRGWGTRVAGEFRWRGLGAGVSYTYRDGGSWVKHYSWARVSAGVEHGAYSARLVCDWALGGYNRERKIETRIGVRMRSGFTVQARTFVEAHIQGTGFGMAGLAGWTF
jgi:hypothetical protein